MATFASASTAFHRLIPCAVVPARLYDALLGDLCDGVSPNGAQETPPVPVTQLLGFARELWFYSSFAMPGSMISAKLTGGLARAMPAAIEADEELEHNLTKAKSDM